MKMSQVELATAGDEAASKVTAARKAHLREAAKDSTQDARELMVGAVAESRQEIDDASTVEAALQKLAEAVVLEREVLPAADDVLLQYSAASPDDRALVEGAARVGFVFLGRRKGRLLARILGVVREYEIISVIPFTSERKRMSVVLQEVVPEVEAAYRLTEILSALLLRVRFHIIRNARIENVDKSQSCMVSKLRIIWKSTVHVRVWGPQLLHGVVEGR